MRNEALARLEAKLDADSAAKVAKKDDDPKAEAEKETLFEARMSRIEQLVAKIAGQKEREGESLS